MERQGGRADLRGPVKRRKAPVYWPIYQSGKSTSVRDMVRRERREAGRLGARIVTASFANRRVSSSGIKLDRKEKQVAQRFLPPGNAGFFIFLVYSLETLKA